MTPKAHGEPEPGTQEVSRETLLRVLTDGPDGILVTDAAGRIRWANPSLTGLLGLDPGDPPAVMDDLVAGACLLRPDGTELPPEQSPMVRATAGEVVEGTALLLLTPDGARRPLRFAAGPVALDDGRPGAWLAISDAAAETATVDALREERDLVAALVQQSPVGIAVLRADDLVVELTNRRFVDIGPEELGAGHRIDEVWPGLARSGLLEVLAEVAKGGPARTLEDVRVDFPGPEVRHFWLSLSRLPQPAGRPERVLLVSRETTAEVIAREQAQEIAAQRSRDLARARITSARLKSLVDLSAVMARIEGLDELLHLVTAESARLLGADSASLFLLNERGTELLGRATVGLDPDVIVGLRIDLAVWKEVAEVVRTGEPAVHPQASRVRGPERPYIDRFGIRSYVVVLLGSPAQPLGVLFVGHHRDEHQFTRAELAFVETLTTYLSVGIERRRLVEGLREAVASLQAALLPESFPEVDGLSVAAEYRSASEVAQVGGDFYDVVRLPDGRVMAVVGDICGKGVAAARHTARLRYELRAVMDEESMPGRALARFNRRVVDEFAEDEYVTMALVRLDPRSGLLEWASAGHPPPLLLGLVPRLAEGRAGLPVGMFPTGTYATTRLELPPGATLVLYTDGVIEARSVSGQEFGWDGLRAATARCCAPASAEAVAGELLEAVTRHAGGSLDDDAAVLVLQRHREP
jgi:serine phosphatase RsbU (regulator of sigma subunit)/PAS domain-containing protein